jgi:excisionase family DNA binding protein
VDEKVRVDEARPTSVPDNARILDSRWDGRSSLTVEEAGCDVLGLSKCSAYAAAKAGKLPTIRIGRRLIVPRAALEKLLAGAA